jgi:pyruvate dehydrogenase E1 component alpha subunit
MGARHSTPGDPHAGLGSLADPETFHGAVELTEGDPDWWRHALARMILIRAAEEKIGDMSAQGQIRCPCHLAIGQEAPAVAVAAHVRRSDRLFGAHRSHAHYLALGGSVRGLMAEVQGKVTGASRGMGGSMHLLDLERGLYGTVPIVGATIPIAVGAGLAAKKDGRGGISVSFFGDGATEEGVFHESLNLAAVLRLPVLFFCENNLFASHLHITVRQPDDSVARYAEAHRVPWALVDGNDVIATARAVREAVDAMRSGGGPRFIEAITYRWRGHVGPREDEDVGVKRKEDLVRWKLRDPIRRLADALLDVGRLGEGQLEDLWAQARTEVDEAWHAAAKDPYPAADELLRLVYARPK